MTDHRQRSSAASLVPPGTNRLFGLTIGLAAACLLITLIGCGSSDGRLGIEGTVTLDGNPLSTGSISFIPRAGTDSPTAGGSISNGAYSISAGQGLRPGSYDVRILASRKTGRQVMDKLGENMVDEIEQYLPTKYNRQTELSATVTADGPNTFDFPLSSN